MHYVLADDSFAFDGYTSARRPLGGAEKAFASLGGALVKRGHSVTVLNRVQYPTWCEGAKWRPIEDPQLTTEADVLIAFRKPGLLGTIRQATRRLLWVTGPSDYLNTPGVGQLFDSLKPTVVFVSPLQKPGFKGAAPTAVIGAGVRDAFYDTTPEIDPFPEMSAGASPHTTPTLSLPPPHAVVTTHPQQGLAWLIDIWEKIIHPQVPQARLAVYSAALHKGMKGEEIAPELKPILELVQKAASTNVVVVEPRSDRGMAEVYRTSRVHLYPSFSQDVACWTLQESQVAGLPAVARMTGGAGEHIINGETGFLVPDASAFGNVAVQILSDENVYRRLSAAACDVARRRTWDMVAADFDALVASMAPNAVS
ncbi:MAG: glycosyltransferase [Rhodospirillaceae bacterium]|nr:glycosyltransferase [Rhodospirillaceae bacterium]